MVPAAAYKVIKEKTKKAMGRIREFNPYKLEAPIQLEVQFKNYRPSEILSYLPNVERIDSHSISFLGKDMIEISKFLAFLNTYRPDLSP